MSRLRVSLYRGGCCLLSIIAIWGVRANGGVLAGQGIPSGGAAPSEKATADYVIGPGDVLTVTIGDSPEMSGRYRVSDSGEITLPSVLEPIKAVGLTAPKLSTAVAAALKDADLLRNPVVNVFVEEYRSRNVTVLGAVNKPGVYGLDRPTTLLQALSLAGGLTPLAGNTITVMRPDQDSAGKGASQTGASLPSDRPTFKVDMSSLLEGKDPSLNFVLRAGDVVSVANAPVVYVIGAVVKPGGYVLQDPKSGITVLQALALAEGLQPIAAAKRSMVIRRSASATDRQEIPIDLAKLMTRKIQDQMLEANDILFVPESGMKKSLHQAGAVVVSGLNGIAIYGLGYRVAGL
jgi:polysaccharide export outer membrane protein